MQNINVREHLFNLFFTMLFTRRILREEKAFMIFFSEIHMRREEENIKGNLTADPGFIGVAPGRGVMTCPPVSVCQNVSAILHFPCPTRL